MINTTTPSDGAVDAAVSAEVGSNPGTDPVTNPGTDTGADLGAGARTDEDAAVAVAAALAGADVVRRLYGTQLERFDKGGGDFATEADVAAEQAILGVLRAARPTDAVLGEEGGQQGAAGSRRQWLVDPLCGTLNYAVGTLTVCVNVALVGGVAAVADPFGDEVFHTDGAGAWVRRGAGDDAPLVPSAASGLVDVNLDPPFPSAPRFRAVELLARPDFGARFRPRALSTSLALAWVAAGKRAAYVTDGGDLSASVHFAAGIALCRAAGCTVTDLDGAPVGETGDGAGRGPVGGARRGLLVAADAVTHQALLSMIGNAG